MLIREADASDNPGLLRLTSRSGMPGRISLRIDRDPDFFGLLRERGDALVFVAEQDRDIVGSYSAVYEDFRVLGATEKVCYIGDLKVDPAFRNTFVAYRLVRTMLDHPRKADTDILFGTAAEGNAGVTGFFGGKTGFPLFTGLGAFRVYQMLPSRNQPRDASCETSVAEHAEGMHDVYNRFTERYRFAKLFREDAFRDCVTVTASIGGAVKASLALVDVRALKQNVLLRIPRSAYPVLYALKAANLVTPVFTVPRPNMPIAILYIRAFAVEDGCEHCLDAAIRRARRYAFEHRYSFLTVGVHERDPLLRVFGRHARFTFTSLGYVTSLKNRTGVAQSIADGASFEDYSLI
jgi:predicted N-acetyltransferase YhbS